MHDDLHDQSATGWNGHGRSHDVCSFGGAAEHFDMMVVTVAKMPVLAAA